MVGTGWRCHRTHRSDLDLPIRETIRIGNEIVKAGTTA